MRTEPDKTCCETVHLVDVVPQAFRLSPPLSKRHFLDLADPVGGLQASRCEFGDDVEHLVREAADVENVLTLGRLRRAAGLQVDADQPGPRIARA